MQLDGNGEVYWEGEGYRTEIERFQKQSSDSGPRIQDYIVREGQKEDIVVKDGRIQYKRILGFRPGT